jgi:4-coumarate--CoA ligase
VLKNEAKGKISENQIQEWMKPRVARHKYLAGGIEFVDQIPRLVSGKIQRKTVRGWAKRDAEALRRGREAMAKL